MPPGCESLRLLEVASARVERDTSHTAAAGGLSQTGQEGRIAVVSAGWGVVAAIAWI